MARRPLRILQLLTHSKINAGGAVQAFLLSRELVRLGHDVTLCFAERTHGPDEATVERVRSAGVSYHGLRLRSLASLADLRRLLVEGRFDVVHVHRELAVQRFLQVAPFAPPVGAVANVGTSKVPSPSRARRLRSRRFDRVVVVAEAIKKLLVHSVGLDPTRVEVVPGAFDEERFRPDVPPASRRDLGVPEDAEVVGVVANLDPKKGHEVLARAAPAVLQRRPRAYFVLAGKGEPGRLWRLVEDAGAPADRFRHLGFREDVPALLRAFDVAVCCSTRGEGLTGAVREAMAMGTPVVSTNVAGNPEIVAHRRTGLLVPAGDPEALAAAIVETLEDRKAAAARAERAQEAVRDRFTSRARAERMAEIYEDVRKWREVGRTSLNDILYPPIVEPESARGRSPARR